MQANERRLKRSLRSAVVSLLFSLHIDNNFKNRTRIPVFIVIRSILRTEVLFAADRINWEFGPAQMHNP